MEMWTERKTRYDINDCDGCRGCCKGESHIEINEKTLICPCSICLVKVTCTKGCQLFAQHVNLIGYYRR